MFKSAAPVTRSASRTLELEPAEHREMVVRLAPQLGVVFITTDPADAELVVDGRPMGPATGRHELTATAHAIEVRRDGYEPHRVTVTPRVATSQKLGVTLKRIDRRPARNNKTGQGQTLTLVPPGRVRMGASRRVAGRRANEALRGAVLQRPFYISLNEVTNAEFRRFDPSHSSGPGLDGDTAPVAGVTWEQAARYLNWLSRADALPPAYEERGKQLVAVRPPTTGYRLPTEAEWEYVARAAGRPEQVTYPWSGAFPPDRPCRQLRRPVRPRHRARRHRRLRRRLSVQRAGGQLRAGAAGCPRHGRQRGRMDQRLLLDPRRCRWRRRSSGAWERAPPRGAGFQLASRERGRVAPQPSRLQ